MRTPDEADKRIVRVGLSDEGRKTAEEFEQSRTEWESRMTACFTEEEAAQFCALSAKLCALSAKLCDHIEKLTGGANAPDNEEK